MVVSTLIPAAMSATLLLAPAAAAADDPGARQLADEALDNLLDAESVRLKLTDRSKDTASSRTAPTSLDLALDRDGNCVGVMDMARHGGHVEIVKQGDEVWMKPDADFWKAQVPGGQGDAAAELFEDRYIHGSVHDPMLRGMADLCDLDSFQKQVGAGETRATDLKKGERTERDGTEVIPLTGREDGKNVTMYVTADSPHRAVEMTQRGGGTDTTVTFDDYDKPVPTKTPSPDDSVDIGRLRQELQGT
ncbi:hypothetical protein [Streptomyces sp. NPDC093094]|uniref:hypothetical protein n=1 Tax=Streptomyces sp. NPDC093094 TaxID=3366026 RepID=UPI00381E0071